MKSYPFTAILPCSDKEGNYRDLWPEGSSPQQTLLGGGCEMFLTLIPFCSAASLQTMRVCRLMYLWGLRELPGLIKEQTN